MSSVKGHVLSLTPTGDRGSDSGRVRWRIECLTCRVILHENTTGPTTWIKQHLDGRRCAYQKKMEGRDAEEADT